MILPLILALATQWNTQSAARFEPASGKAEGLLAEIVVLPKRAEPATFAGELVEREGLKPWNPAEPTSSNERSRFAHKARHAGNGREITVYYDRQRSPGSDHVCRIRRSRGGASDAHYAAVRWCAASFGITLPITPRPPVVSDPARE